MLQTTQDMYYAFLDGIKKNSTAIVTPAQFNRIINNWGQDEYLIENFYESEKDAVEIDDLENLRVATDGLQTIGGILLYPIAPDAGSTNVFTIPKKIATGIRRKVSDTTTDTATYPLYARGLNVMFKIKYGASSPCKTAGTISDYVLAYIMRSDQRAVIMDSPRRKPSDTFLYYELIDSKIRLIAGNGAEGYSLRLEYFRYPVAIFYNVTNPTDTGDPATGSVNCEFSSHQRKDIVDIAVRIYLERVSDPRYKTFLNEENIRANN